MRQVKKRPFPLLLLLVSFVSLSLLFNQAIPPFEGPDGPEHFAYIEWLAGGKGFPPQGRAAWETPVRQEASQPPLYYALAALPARLVGLDNPAAVYRPNPYFPSSAPGHIADNKNIAIHYPADTRPLAGGWLALYLARAVSLLSGCLLIVAVYGLARELLAGQQPPVAGQQPSPLAAAAFVAFMPQVLFLSNVVSNDMLAAATGALTLWLLARLVRRGPTMRRALLLGAVFGLGALTKSSVLALAVPLALGLVWRGLPGRGLSGRHTFVQVLYAGFWLGTAAFAVAGWWYVRAWWLYGSPLGLDTHCYAPWAFCGDPPRQGGIGAAWREVYYSFWAAFGWGNIKFPGWVYGLWTVWLLFPLVGLGHLAARRRSLTATTQLLGVLLLASIVVEALALAGWMRQVTAPHGRLLFPALAAVPVLLVAGWTAVRPRLAWAGVASVLLLSLLSLLALIRPAYAQPRFLTPEALYQKSESNSLGWQFGGFAQLDNVILNQQSAAAGEVLPVEICWQTLAAADRDYSQLVHIVGPGDRVIAGRRSYPGLGSFPTSIWQPGRRFCDLIRIDIPADLEQTLVYRVEVGWIDETTGRRVTAYDGDGQARSHTFANAVRLQAAQPPALAAPPPATYGIALAGYDLPLVWRAGQTQPFTLRWWVNQELRDDLTTFVHLRDPLTSENVAQADGPPLDGWYPTSHWQKSELIVDKRLFPLPDDLPPGHYDLIVGWYDPVTGLPWGRAYPLGTIKVQR